MRLIGMAGSTHGINEDAGLDAKEELKAFIDNAKVDMAVFPGEQPEDWHEYALTISGYKKQSDVDHLIDGLRKAGLGSEWKN